MFRTAAFLIPALLLCACGGGAGGGDAQAAAPIAANGNPAAGAAATLSLHDIQATPYALFTDEMTDRVITVTARTQSTGQIALSLNYFDGLVGGSGAQISRSMYDDGTHGDAVAADGIWSRSFTLDVGAPPTLRLYDGQVDSLPISIQVSDRGAPLAPSNAIDARVEVALISAQSRDTVAVRSATSNTLTTDTMVNIVDPNFDGTALGTVTARLYGLFAGDPFDFAVIFHSRTTGDGIPRSIGVRNDVGGINLATFDQSAGYGSAGRLQQIIVQNAHTLGLEVNHEIGHRWAAYLNKPALNLALPTGFHWGASNHVGQMGNGPYLQPEGSQFRVTNGAGSDHFVSNAFSTLELYLMGLARADEVAPLRFVTDPAVNVQFNALLPAASTRAVTIDDITGVYGVRQPDSNSAQNAFNAAFVVVSDQLLTAAEYTLTSTIAAYAAGTSMGGQRTGGLFEVSDPPSFSAATGYRASLETHLPATL